LYAEKTIPGEKRVPCWDTIPCGFGYPLTFRLADDLEPERSTQTRKDGACRPVMGCGFGRPSEIDLKPPETLAAEACYVTWEAPQIQRPPGRRPPNFIGEFDYFILFCLIILS